MKQIHEITVSKINISTQNLFMKNLKVKPSTYLCFKHFGFGGSDNFWRSKLNLYFRLFTITLSEKIRYSNICLHTFFRYWDFNLFRPLLNPKVTQENLIKFRLCVGSYIFNNLGPIIIPRYNIFLGPDHYPEIYFHFLKNPNLFQMACVDIENRTMTLENPVSVNIPEITSPISDVSENSPVLSVKKTIENTVQKNETSSKKKPKKNKRTLDKNFENKSINKLISTTNELSIEDTTDSFDSKNQEPTNDEATSEKKKLENIPKTSIVNNTIKQIKDIDAIFVSIDVEQWERNNHIVTEIGITTYHPSNHFIPEMRAAHFIVQEYLKLRNGRFVSDNKSNFAYGKSEVLPMSGCIKAINYVFSSLSAKYKNVVLVGHNVGGDIRALRKFGIEFPKAYSISDTESIWRETRPSGPSSLEALLQIFNIPYSFLHNAGMAQHLNHVLFFFI